MEINESTLYTDKQEEKIYSATEKDSKEKIISEFQNFFKELIKRKRNDPIEGGLQAVMIIFPNIFAAKINEDDGMGTHGQSKINAIKFINGDHEYLTEYGIRHFYLYEKELKQLLCSCIDIRILDGEETLMLAITSNKELYSTFEVQMLKRIILICNILMEKKYYKNVDIGLYTPKIKIDYGEWTTEKRNLMLEEISKNMPLEEPNKNFKK